MKTLVEIAAFPPPMGSWSLRVDIVGRRWKDLGHDCVLMNIGQSRKLGDSKYVNVRGPFDYVFKVFRAAIRGQIIHTHTNAKGIKGTLLALCAQCVTILCGRRAVLTFHAGVHQQYFPKTGKWRLDALMWLLFKTPSAIICNSEHVKRRIVEDYHVAENKVHVIPAFCGAYMETELAKLPPDVDAFFQSHDPVLVSYVFFFHPEFTVDMMVRAVARLRGDYPSLGLVIMGSKQFVEDYLPLIKELELTDHVLLPGNLPRGEFLNVLASGALYLRTPMGDGVAASVLEAMALETPVVASDNGTRPPGCVLYRGDDLDDMIAKVKYVLENRDSVVAKIDKPDDGDTVEREVELLLSV